MNGVSGATVHSSWKHEAQGSRLKPRLFCERLSAWKVTHLRLNWFAQHEVCAHGPFWFMICIGVLG